MAEVEFRRVRKVFPDGTCALSGLDLKIAEGEFMVLVGPSGCGKTTALRLLAGLETVTAGEITIAGRVVNGMTPQQRNIAMVFQNYALYPHMTVRANLEFPLRMRRLPRDERERRVARAAELLGITALLERKPRALSGGQRQRVAMGRAIVRDPTVFLMDEPLSNLDARLRVRIRTEISALQRRMGVATIYVTHDQVEAMTLGDRVAALSGGVLQQVAPPQTLYEYPANTFVAGFIGSPPMNLFDAVLHRVDGGFVVEIGGQRLPVGHQAVRRQAGIDAFANARLIAGLRPDAFDLPGEGRAGAVLQGVVVGSEYLGNETLLYFRFPDGSAAARQADIGPGGVSTGAAGTARLFLAERRFQPGDRVALGVHPDGFYFFTPRGEAVPYTTGL